MGLSLLKVTSMLWLVLSIQHWHYLSVRGAFAWLFLWLTIIWTKSTPVDQKPLHGQPKGRFSNAWTSQVIFPWWCCSATLYAREVELEHHWKHPEHRGTSTHCTDGLGYWRSPVWERAQALTWCISESFTPTQSLFLLLSWHFHKLPCYLTLAHHVAFKSVITKLLWASTSITSLPA